MFKRVFAILRKAFRQRFAAKPGDQLWTKLLEGEKKSLGGSKSR